MNKRTTYYSQSGIFENVSGPGFVYMPGKCYMVKIEVEIDGTIRAWFGYGSTEDIARQDAEDKYNRDNPRTEAKK
jgi:hypothetical protein